ncbi:MAG: ankyrin repeat domain-containing protein, partial [Endozoicomonadaceae bacterium]|nr:ankyrin repeat domain-containing protein [Endozoicomonadaceae bacterium]
KGDAMAAEQLMQDENIDINVKLYINPGETDNYMTPLMIAVWCECSAFAESLIKRSADINAQDNAGYTALMYAASQGFTKIAQLLVSHQANIDVQNQNNVTALMFAILENKVETAVFLIDSGADLNLQNTHGYTALMFAAEEGLTEIVKYLLKMKAAIDMQTLDGRTPLMIATKCHPDIAILLLDMGANPNLTQSDGLTVLMCAIMKKKIPVINALVTHGADLNVSNKCYKFTPLTMAASTGLAEVVYLLIKHKANIDLQDNSDNDTALTSAISAKHFEIANFLIDEGACLDLQNNTGHTALMIAASYGQTEIVKKLVAKGAGLDIEDTCNHTALTHAISGKRVESAIFLIDSGAELNLRRVLGYTPLIFTAWTGQTEIIMHLINKGADVNATDASEKETALTYYLVSGEKDFADTVKFMLKKGAKFDINDPAHMSALKVAFHRLSETTSELCGFDVLLILSSLLKINDTNHYYVVTSKDGEKSLTLAQKQGRSVHHHILIRDLSVLKQIRSLLPLTNAVQHTIRETFNPDILNETLPVYVIDRIKNQTHMSLKTRIEIDRLLKMENTPNGRLPDPENLIRSLQKLSCDDFSIKD